MKIVYNADPVVKSLRRLVELSRILQKNNDPVIYAGIKRESNILLRRTVKLWINIRVRENRLPWRVLDKLKIRKQMTAIKEDDEEFED
ncbi:MAG: hypothetical protein JW762_06465 [Dehalococcoidales bacterium]|nr:hypothetical protein [Dehalococcoidales bacterium]